MDYRDTQKKSSLNRNESSIKKRRKRKSGQGRTGEVNGIHKAVRTCGDGSCGESLAREYERAR